MNRIKKQREIPIYLKYIISAGIFALSSILFLFVFTFAAYLTSDPLSLVNYFGYGALILSVLVASAISRGLFEGAASTALAGAIFALILFVISLFFKGGLTLPVSLLLLAAVPLLSFVGGVLFRKKKTKNNAMAKYKKLR